MTKISNVEVFGLESSIYRSGYPMLTEAPSEEMFKTEVETIRASLLHGIPNNHVIRASKLAWSSGGGHDQFLTGIVVNFDLTVPNKVWVEAERYTFLNFISSMSSMHRASRFMVEDSCNQYVSQPVIDEANRLQREYNEIDENREPERKKEAYLRLLYNLPSGFELMAGMTTNYRCLKNIRAQRRNHRLPDWQVICDWIEKLPMATYLIL